ncbi:MAG: hypothetical protein D9V47_04510 [Clostridia bacterium]|nr:MAG: hypothetical protein D9V47_04510 [Clostridia bacterium]
MAVITKRIRLVVVVGMATLALASGQVKPVGDERADSDALAKASFQAIQAEPVGAEIQGWGPGKAGMPGEPRELETLARRLTEDLGATAGEFRWEEYPDLYSVSLTGAAPGGVSTYTLVQSQPGADGKFSIFSSVRTPGPFLSPWPDRLAAALRQAGVVPELRWQYTATLPGKLSHAEQRKVVAAVMGVYGAVTVEGVAEEELYSVSAYTHKLQPAVDVAGRQINLNVGLRYHSYDHLTYLYLGIPLLDGEY